MNLWEHLNEVLLISVAYVLLFAPHLLANGTRSRQNSQDETRRPNIVILMSDDQDLMLNSMDVMRYTRDLVISQGATFGNAFTTSPICCPSRSSFLTGLYSHNHNVLTNNDNCSSLAWQQTHETRTFATYLNRSGYTTAYFGKYLNEYDGSYTPPGWQYWMGLIKNTKYYNYTLRHNDTKETHKDDYAKDYLTDLIVNRSMDYFQQRRQEEPNKPVLTFLSFPAPHGSEDGAPQYQHLYQNITSHITPSFDYGPNDDKHWIISQVKGPMDSTQHRYSSILQQKRLQTLRSVDDGVAKFMRMLEDTGELDNTYVLYTSDHGFHIGQFGLAKGKSMPYDFDIRVPFYLRGPGIPAGLSINDIVLNIDIAPTILGIAGVDIPEWMDGRNFMPLIKSRSSISPPWRDSFLVQRGKIPHSKIHMAKPKSPSKQAKVEQACLSPEFKHPCDRGQIWTCVQDEGITKMRKCNKYPKPESKSAKKKVCTCPKKVGGTLPPKCRRRIASATRGRRRVVRRDINPSELDDLLGGGLASSDRWSLDPENLLMFDPLSRPRRRAGRNRFDVGRGVSGKKKQMVLSPKCKIVMPGYKLRCTKGPSSWKRENWKRLIQAHKARIRVLKVLEDCAAYQSRRREKCKCQAAKSKSSSRSPTVRNRASTSVSSNETNAHPMRTIIEEINEEHNRRVEQFRLWRREHQDERQSKREKIARRMQEGGGRCSSSPGLGCFRLSSDRWRTPPVWDGPERCYCTNASNNTYWCVRIINETANMLYCEFLTGFIEFYDLRTDPHQLTNTYAELSSSKLSALNAELAHLRVCRGAAGCHVPKDSQSPTTTPASTSTVLPSTTSPPPPTTTATTEAEPVMQTSTTTSAASTTISTTTAPTTTEHIPTNYPLGGYLRPPRYRRKNRRNNNRRLACSPSLKRRNYSRWRAFCRSKRQSYGWRYTRRHN